MPLLLRIAGVDLSIGGPPVASDITTLSSSRRETQLAEYQGHHSLGNASPPGYGINQRTLHVGKGKSVWRRAVKGLETADVLDLDWARFWRLGNGARWQEGDVVIVGARLLPAIWVANVNRVVGVERRRDSVSVAWGTTARHVLKGEEVVCVQRSKAGDVRVKLRSFSRPKAFLAWLGYPVVKFLQIKFAHDVCDRMAQIAAPTQ